jgi:splicing factor 3A subunit 3
MAPTRYLLTQFSQRKDEIQAMMGNGQPFATFYEQLGDLKAYHRKYPYLTIERPEAEQILNNLDTVDNLFTGEEGHGKFLDLHSFYQLYINFKDVPKDLEYMQYLEFFSTFPHRKIGLCF